MGCNQYRQHQRQKLRLAFVPRRWRESNKGLWVSGTKILATLGAIVAIVSGIASTTLAVLKA